MLATVLMNPYQSPQVAEVQKRRFGSWEWMVIAVHGVIGASFLSVLRSVHWFMEPLSAAELVKAEGEMRLLGFMYCAFCGLLLLIRNGWSGEPGERG